MHRRILLAAAMLLATAGSAAGQVVVEDDGDLDVLDVADVTGTSASQVTVSQDVDLDTGDVLAYLALRGGESPWEDLTEEGGVVTVTPHGAAGVWRAHVGCDREMLAYPPENVAVALLSEEGEVQNVWAGASLADAPACQEVVACYVLDTFECRLAQSDAEMLGGGVGVFTDTIDVPTVDPDDEEEVWLARAMTGVLEQATGQEHACGDVPPMCIRADLLRL